MFIFGRMTIFDRMTICDGIFRVIFQWNGHFRWNVHFRSNDYFRWNGHFSVKRSAQLQTERSGSWGLVHEILTGRFSMRMTLPFVSTKCWFAFAEISIVFQKHPTLPSFPFIRLTSILAIPVSTLTSILGRLNVKQPGS